MHAGTLCPKSCWGFYERRGSELFDRERARYGEILRAYFQCVLALGKPSFIQAAHQFSGQRLPFFPIDRAACCIRDLEPHLADAFLTDNADVQERRSARAGDLHVRGRFMTRTRGEGGKDEQERA